MSTIQLAPPPAARVDVEAAEEWSRLWFSLSERPWGSLALLPATADGSALGAAERLQECAQAYGAGPLHVVDAQGAAPSDVALIMSEVTDHLRRGHRVLVVVASPRASAPAIPLARATDGAVLVVPLGETGILDARRAVAAVGHARFVGSITVRES